MTRDAPPGAGREFRWSELERALRTLDERGLRGLDVASARKLARLYRATSADLVRVRADGDERLEAYLNDLVRRAYAWVHGRRPRDARGPLAFLRDEFPPLVRAEIRPISLAAALFFVGAAVGAGGLAFDPSSHAILVPVEHQERMPEERVVDDEHAEVASSDTQAMFSSFLFTNNIRVTFLAFALGITAGVGTALVLLANGVPIGALAVQYAQANQTTFFYAWILPHGVLELTAIFIAGGAGLVLGRGLVFAGRRRRATALRRDALRAVKLVLGCMPILVVAGVIEGTVSQMHEPVVTYEAKLAFAACMAVALFFYLARTGRPKATRSGSTPANSKPAYSKLENASRANSSPANSVRTD